MDIFIEIFLEIYMEVMLLIVPEKHITKKHKIIATLLAILVLAGVFALVIWGIVLIVDKSNLWGLLPLGIALLISILQIVLGVVLYKKTH